MAKVVENDVMNVNDGTIVEETFDPTVVYATLVKREDGYHLIDFDGTDTICKLDKSGEWVILPKNKSNRKCMSVNAVEKALVDSDHVDLYYKATRQIGSTGPSVPGKNLIKYLDEADQAEFMAIIERARAAKMADRPAPKSEEDKLREKIAKLQARLDELND